MPNFAQKPQFTSIISSAFAREDFFKNKDANPLFSTKTGIATPKTRGVTDLSAKILILLSVLLIISAGFALKIYETLVLPESLGRILIVTFQATMVIFVLTLIWRVVLVMRYRPTPAYPDTKLPTCGVIVPAYNEGRQVLETLRSIAQSDYPEEKLKIVVIDDGSKDDTWRWIRTAVQEMPNRITHIRLSSN